jgi:hypothetical protein
MSRAALLLVLPILVACSKNETPAADTSAAAAAPAPAATAPAAAPNVAGTWNVKVMPQAKDTVLLTYTLVATNDKTGWKLTLPNRPTMDGRVMSMDNDSVVIENGPYSSVLRKNQQVWTHSAMHLEGDKLVGTTVAHYTTKGADSVVMLRTEGTRQ